MELIREVVTTTIIANKLKVGVCRGEPIASKKQKYVKGKGKRNREAFKKKFSIGCQTAGKAREKSFYYYEERGGKIEIFFIPVRAIWPVRKIQEELMPQHA